MSERHRWERLIGMMEKERDLLDEFASRTGALRSALHERDWSVLEGVLRSLDDLADRIDAVEKKREVLAARVCEDRNIFEKRLSDLPPEVRGRFSILRNELKACLVTVRSRMRGIAGYAESRSRLGRDVMEELIPSTRGRMYDNRGRAAASGGDPLVVSRQL